MQEQPADTWGMVGVHIGVSLQGLWQPVLMQVLGAGQPSVPVPAQVQQGFLQHDHLSLQALSLKVSPAQPPKAGLSQLGEQRSGPARVELPGPQVSTGGRALTHSKEVVVFLVQK